MARVIYDFDDNDDEKLLSTKYKFGEKFQKQSELEELTLSFAYDYISLEKTNLCFNNPKITAKDYAELYRLKQEISSVSISQLLSISQKSYRFHPMNFNGNRKYLLPIIGQILSINIQIGANRDQLPTIYQIELYTRATRSPRIFGFIGNYAIFHLLWFDYDHSIYPMTTT